MNRLHLCALAHDMRAPLQAMDALTGLIAAHAGNETAVRAYSHRLRAACAQLLALAGEMAGQTELCRFSLCAPRALAQEAAMLFGDRIACTYAGDCLCPVPVDAQSVRRILINLLQNAVKYSPPDADIALDTQVDQDEVRFCVRDKGMGMEEETMERLFSPYVRGQEAMDLPGTGLGLYASRVMAEEMGAALCAESRRGEGSTFTLALPRIKPEWTLKGKRFLVAEDNDLAGDALCEMLEACGAHAMRAQNGQEAV